MDALTIAAASGMRARMESLEILANNIANQASPGFKKDQEFYYLYMAPEALADAQAGLAPFPQNVPLIEKQWTDFTQGVLSTTGNPSHFALSGNGFFTVQGRSGPLYTRNGSFQLSSAGRLQTQEGYPVWDQQGKPIQLDPNAPFEVTQSGEIRQSGAVLGTIGTVDFPEPNVLTKETGTYFRLNDDALRPATSTATVHQGKLEAANGSPAESAVRLVSVMRQFEMLQKAITIGGEMNRKADEVARVAS